jgi:hypothetical protein
MSETLTLPAPSAQRDTAQGIRHYQATLGRFDEPGMQAKIDELSRWVEETYRADLAQRPSKHVYIAKLPPEIIGKIDEVRDHTLIREAILRQYPANYALTPMKHTDELYISHYNKDFGGDQGLFDKHYDGNLRFLPFSSTVRALIYLQSDATYKVVFRDSNVEQAFTTYEFGLLDFHREYHWVEGEYNPSDQQRILLKCNYLIAPADSRVLKSVAMAANTSVFYVVKKAMEYSKSPKTPFQYAVGFLCNFFRVTNNIHPLVPLAAIAAVTGLAVWGVLRLVG